MLLQEQKDSAFTEKSKDAFDESDDESAISRTESELREVTKVKDWQDTETCVLLSQDICQARRTCSSDLMLNCHALPTAICVLS